jgi:hypothetical protein
MTEEARYCLSEAARCYRLARGCFDKKLVEIGDEFASRALTLGADPLELPDRWDDGIIFSLKNSSGSVKGPVGAA